MILLLNRNINPITHTLRYAILQDSKRLRTFQRPQESDIHPIPKQIFEDALLLTLIRLQSAFEKLQQEQVNTQTSAIKSITMQGITKLEVQSGKGWFIFQGNHDLSTFFYTSPFNGVFKYYYDINTKRWLSNKDKHIFEQNLAREIQGKFAAYLDI